jgi:hypothetical protein
METALSVCILLLTQTDAADVCVESVGHCPMDDQQTGVAGSQLRLWRVWIAAI